MKTMMKGIGFLAGLIAGLIILICCITMLGCITLKQRFTGDTESIINMINTGKAAELAKITETPFLLDGEIIILPRDMAAFWAGIIKAGFRIGEPVLVEARPADQETYREFASTMEAESFFLKYISADCHVVLVETEEIRILFLMDRTEENITRIRGFKGPLEL